LIAEIPNIAEMRDGGRWCALKEREFVAITDVIETYEAKRWPHGKVPGEKG